MTALGADVDQLDELARRLGAAASMLTQVRSGTTAAVRSAAWSGPDADAFRSRWTGVSAAESSRIASAVEAQSDAVRAQARAQRLASAGPGAGGPTPKPSGPPPPAPTGQPLPADRVVRTEILEASGQLGIGPLQVQLQGQYRIEHLADGTVRLTEILDQRAGAGADAGARIELDAGAHEYRSGAMAGAAALAGVRTGRTWAIPADQVDEVIVSSNLDRVDPGGVLRRAASEGNQLVDRALPDGIGPVDLPFDEASSAYRHYLDARTPTPVRQGVDVVASAEAYAILGVGPGSVDARAAAGIQAGGFVEADGDVGLRFQVDASASAGLDSPALSIPGLLDPPSAGAQFTQSTELLFGRDGQPKQVVIETVAGSAEHPTMQRLTVDIVTDQQRADVQAMRDFFVDPSGRNAARLAAIDGSDWAPHAHRLDADLSVGGEDYGAGAGAGAIPGFIEGSADVKFEHQTIDHDDGNPIR